MNTSSEYTFPIFISSTDYNLKDLRAELASFLSELGYKPILSSSEGFPDSFPNKEPWESCLPVIDHCFTVVLVIDGRYGKSLPWPNMGELFKDRNISPTHAEYIYTHATKKRMLVFIRKEVMVFYQAFRVAMKNVKGIEEDAKKILEKTLPEHIDFESMKFINEVKTTRPIPWIKEFEDVTDIKKEVQKKMLNELCELFLIKGQHLEMVITAFDKVMGTLSSDEQKSILLKLNATTNLIKTKEKVEQDYSELKKAKEQLEKLNENETKKRSKLEADIIKLKDNIAKLEDETLKSHDDPFYISGGALKIGKPVVLGMPVFDTAKYGFTTHFQYNNHILSNEMKSCEQCGKKDLEAVNSLFGDSIMTNFRVCPSCHRMLCKTCWPVEGYLFNTNTCPQCSSTIVDTN